MFRARKSVPRRGWEPVARPRLRLIGSGQGAIGAREYLAELPALVEAITDGRIDVGTREVALTDIERAWDLPEEPGVRTVVRAETA